MTPDPFARFVQNMPQTNLPQPLPQMPAPKKGGMFGGGTDWASAIQAVIGGYLSGMGAPGGRELLGQVHQRQLLAQKLAMQQQDRQADLEDYGKKLEMQAQYRAPPQPTEYERLLQAMGVQPGTPDYQEHVGRYVGAKENPIVMTPYGPMPYSSVVPQTKPVGKLTPIDDGGPTASPSGMFPSLGY